MMMKKRANSSSVNSSTRTNQPHFLMGLLGREAETYADAFLVSQEGKMLPVVRSLLAMKCRFFKEKFFPGSVERLIRAEAVVDENEPSTDDVDLQTAYAFVDGTTGATENTGEQTEGSTAAETVGTVVQETEEATVPVANTEGAPAPSSAYATSAEMAAEIATPNASSKGTEPRAASATPEVPNQSEKKMGTEGGETMNSFAQVPTGHAKPRYPMPFPMILLKQVVEFIYTDSVSFLQDVEFTMKPWRASPNASFVSCPPSCEVASHIVELSRAADYVQLKDLCLQCCEMLRVVVKARKSTACAALGAIHRKENNPPFLNRVASLLVKSINGDVKKSFCVTPCNRSQASGEEASCQCYGAFGLCTVMHLNSRALEEVIHAQARGFSDEYMLQVVYFWATGGKRFSSSHMAALMTPVGAGMTTDVDSGIGNADTDSEQKETMELTPTPSFEPETNPFPADGEMIGRGIALVCARKSTPSIEVRFFEGKALTSKFNLGAMNPSFLHEYVENSGLVDKETLYNVYRNRALSGPRFVRIFSIMKRGCPPRCDHMSTGADQERSRSGSLA